MEITELVEKLRNMVDEKYKVHQEVGDLFAEGSN